MDYILIDAGCVLPSTCQEGYYNALSWERRRVNLCLSVGLKNDLLLYLWENALKSKQQLLEGIRSPFFLFGGKNMMDVDEGIIKYNVAQCNYQIWSNTHDNINKKQSSTSVFIHNRLFLIFPSNFYPSFNLKSYGLFNGCSQQPFFRLFCCILLPSTSLSLFPPFLSTAFYGHLVCCSLTPAVRLLFPRFRRATLTSAIMPQSKHNLKLGAAKFTGLKARLRPLGFTFLSP